MATINTGNKNRYDKLFNDLTERNEVAFIPFITLGFPNKDQCLKLIRQMVKAGADALELGFPYSDPIADGPIIQKANIMALNAGISRDDCFDILATIRAEFPNLPIGLLLYANLVYGTGLDETYERAKNVGVDSILIADAPLREISTFKDAATRHTIQQVLILPPDANHEKRQAIANLSEGYLYLLSRSGITGTETRAGIPTRDLIKELTTLNSAPLVLGFGIKTPTDVAAARSAGVAGVISGSAVIEQILLQLEKGNDINVSKFIQAMKRAAKRPNRMAR